MRRGLPKNLKIVFHLFVSFPQLCGFFFFLEKMKKINFSVLVIPKSISNHV